jgi:glycosyltransferase involved in cell wall biosynthesis
MVYKSSGSIVFIVVGRLGNRLTISKIQPFIPLTSIDKIYVFAENKGSYLDKTIYVSHPQWLSKLKPEILRKVVRLIFEPLQLIHYSIKYRPFIINGVFTLPKGLYSFIAAKISSAKCVVSVIGGIPEITTYSKFHKFYKRLNLWIYKNSDIVTTKGEMVKDYLIDHNINKQKLIVLNGAIDTDSFENIGHKVRDIDILFIGNFSELKGPDRVVRVVQKLISQFGLTKIKATFLGKGKEFDRIARYVLENNLSDNIEIVGYSNKIIDFIARSKTLLMPSRSEGLSTAMLEAMMGGCVPIISNVGNMTDAAFHRKNSFVVEDYNDIDMFAEHAHLLITNDLLRNKLSEEGIKLVEKRYSITAQAAVIQQIVNKLQ